MWDPGITERRRRTPGRRLDAAPCLCNQIFGVSIVISGKRGKGREGFKSFETTLEHHNILNFRYGNAMPETGEGEKKGCSKDAEALDLDFMKHLRSQVQDIEREETHHLRRSGTNFLMVETRD